jgi:nitrite reductase/ring-hydroxylating ferredoxin subunit
LSASFIFIMASIVVLTIIGIYLPRPEYGARGALLRRCNMNSELLSEAHATQPKAVSAAATSSRWASARVSVVTALEVGGAALLFLRARSQEGSFGEVITAGAVDKFPPGSVTEFAAGGFFLIRAPDSGFLAVYRRCPHLGCTVEWHPEDDNALICPCHASTFNIHGDYERSPVPRAARSL